MTEKLIKFIEKRFNVDFNLIELKSTPLPIDYEVIQKDEDYLVENGTYIKEFVYFIYIKPTGAINWITFRHSKFNSIIEYNIKAPTLILIQLSKIIADRNHPINYELYRCPDISLIKEIHQREKIEKLKKINILK